MSLCVSMQNVVSLDNGRLVQRQTWDGKETTIEREVVDNKFIAVRTDLSLLHLYHTIESLA